jgi:hypothetical protein
MPDAYERTLREIFNQFYIGRFTGSFARGISFQEKELKPYQCMWLVARSAVS